MCSSIHFGDGAILNLPQNSTFGFDARVRGTQPSLEHKESTGIGFLNILSICEKIIAETII